MRVLLDRRPLLDVSVRRSNPAIPHALEAIVAKCLAVSTRRSLSRRRGARRGPRSVPRSTGPSFRRSIPRCRERLHELGRSGIAAAGRRGGLPASAWLRCGWSSNGSRIRARPLPPIESRELRSAVDDLNRATPRRASALWTISRTVSRVRHSQGVPRPASTELAAQMEAGQRPERSARHSPTPTTRTRRLECRSIRSLAEQLEELRRVGTREGRTDQAQTREPARSTDEDRLRPVHGLTNTGVGDRARSPKERQRSDREIARMDRADRPTPTEPSRDLAGSDSSDLSIWPRPSRNSGEYESVIKRGPTGDRVVGLAARSSDRGPAAYGSGPIQMASAPVAGAHQAGREAAKRRIAGRPRGAGTASRSAAEQGSPGLQQVLHDPGAMSRWRSAFAGADPGRRLMTRVEIELDLGRLGDARSASEARPRGARSDTTTWRGSSIDGTRIDEPYKRFNEIDTPPSTRGGRRRPRRRSTGHRPRRGLTPRSDRRRIAATFSPSLDS